MGASQWESYLSFVAVFVPLFVALVLGFVALARRPDLPRAGRLARLGLVIAFVGPITLGLIRIAWWRYAVQTLNGWIMLNSTLFWTIFSVLQHLCVAVGLWLLVRAVLTAAAEARGNPHPTDEE